MNCGSLGGGDRVAEGRVHHDDAGGGGGGNVDIVDADPGPPNDLELYARLDHSLVRLGRRPQSQPIIVSDGLQQLGLREADLHVGDYAAISKDVDGGRGKGVGNEHARGHAVTPVWGRRGGVSQAARSSAATAEKAHSSHGMSASRSEASTVAPHQIRKPGGASR